MLDDNTIVKMCETDGYSSALNQFIHTDILGMCDHSGDNLTAYAFLGRFFKFYRCSRCDKRVKKPEAIPPYCESADLALHLASHVEKQFVGTLTVAGEKDNYVAQFGTSAPATSKSLPFALCKAAILSTLENRKRLSVEKQSEFVFQADQQKKKLAVRLQQESEQKTAYEAAKIKKRAEYEATWKAQAEADHQKRLATLTAQAETEAKKEVVNEVTRKHKFSENMYYRKKLAELKTSLKPQVEAKYIAEQQAKKKVLDEKASKEAQTFILTKLAKSMESNQSKKKSQQAVSAAEEMALHEKIMKDETDDFRFIDL